MEFSRQEYWDGKPFPSPGDLPYPQIKPRSSALQGDSLPSEPPGKPNNFGFSIYKSFCPQIVILLLFPFQIVWLFSCIFAVARISNFMLNKSNKNYFSCSDNKTKNSNFSPLRMILVVGLLYVAFIKWRHTPSYTHFVERF